MPPKRRLLGKVEGRRDSNRQTPTKEGGRWNQAGTAQFSNAGVFADTLSEAGITIQGHWQSPDQSTLLGQGIVRFGQALLGGLTRLQASLGGGAVVARGSLFRGAYAPPWLPNTVFVPESEDANWLRRSAVHELAHVIDWHNLFSTKWAKANDSPTAYAASEHPCPSRWEVWAEAVKVFVFGRAESEIISGVLWIDDAGLAAQVDAMRATLAGSR